VAASVSVVVIGRDEGKELRLTVENLEDTLPAKSEIVVVDDGSRDGSADFLAQERGRIRLKRTAQLGVARARNFGARCTRSDIIVFADAHIRLDRLWWQPLLEPLENPSVGAVAPAVTDLRRKMKPGYGWTLTGPGLDIKWLRKKSSEPFAAPILPGCCLAIRRDCFEAAGGWDEGLLVRGGIDNEFCLRLWLLGWDLLIAPGVEVRHKFRKRSPYGVGWTGYIHNGLRLAFAHLKPERMAEVVLAMRRHPEFGAALAMLVERDISARRREMMARRVRNDDWYFERFGLRW
jgi:GT2 family glycosyltransferase